MEESLHVITKVWPFATPVAVCCCESLLALHGLRQYYQGYATSVYEILQPWLYGLWQHFVYGMRKTKHVEHFRSWVISVSVTNIWGRAVPWLRSLVAGLSPWRLGFTPGSIHVGFVVDKVALGQVFLQVLQFSPVNISFHHHSPNSSSGECVIC
jgi:hypothetical protein